MSVILHVGLPKTGTTALQRHFFPVFPGIVAKTPDDHPFRELSLNLWIADDADFLEATWRDYLAALRDEAPDVILSREGWCRPRDPWSGEPRQARTAERLHRLAPDARILMVVRSQPSMVRSMYSQYLKTGGGLRFDRWAESVLDRDLLRYEVLVGRYGGLFGPDRVKVMAYEQLARQPEDFLQELAGFIRPDEPAPAAALNIAVENRALGPLSQWTFRQTNRWIRRQVHNPAPGVKRVSKVRYIQQPVVRLERRFLQNLHRDLPARDRAVIDELSTALAAGNATLEQISGLDLRALGYPLPAA